MIVEILDAAAEERSMIRSQAGCDEFHLAPRTA